jgi:hypothetical protein
MNAAVKLNPNFATAFLDRGVAYYDKHDFDRKLAGRDAEIAAPPTYALNADARGGSYENRREGDRIIQDASAPIPSNRYNAVAYSPDTYPAASPALLPEAARTANAAAPHAEVAHPPPEKPEAAKLMPVRTQGTSAAERTSTSAPIARTAPPPAPPPRTASQPVRAVPVPAAAPQKPKPKQAKPAQAKPRLHIPARVAQTHAEARRPGLVRPTPQRRAPAKPRRLPPPPLWR